VETIDDTRLPSVESNQRLCKKVNQPAFITNLDSRIAHVTNSEDCGADQSHIALNFQSHMGNEWVYLFQVRQKDLKLSKNLDLQF
jgi:hypothetical protein